ncbi:hypothetical protein NEF87_001260 [Candidatus Lokiarchaeum ossiferum]|uniref:Uncharacterized protein n=1 Tax=Candidatus Lokiarchaeum ossiferum TaxID=2951803 RepID=A0ABY6HNJ8_9ARCH|nr:hypothetical protein NEF87_001260 [Candidatus Lokiarchaeum sp. B-35]
MVKTTEKRFPPVEILKRMQLSFKNHFNITGNIHNLDNNPYLRFVFNSRSDFEFLYDQDYEAYAFLYDHILTNEMDFNFIEETVNRNKPSEPKDVAENYLIFHYKSNTIEPMRRNYRLTTKMNNLMGQNIAYEEIETGFLRFIHSKEDFESMLVMTTKKKGWEDYFKSKQISLTHPTIQTFFEIVDRWEQKVREKHGVLQNP